MIKQRLHSDPFAAAQAVAQEIAQLIKIRSKSGSKTVLGLATGATPLRLYAELIRHHREEGLSFQDVITFNLDEYANLAEGHPQSYRYYMQENFFRYIDIVPTNTHVPSGVTPDHSREAARYEAAVQNVGGIDLQILGIGRTGHIGFNEPPSALETRTRWVPLAEVTRQDNSSSFGQLSLVPLGAITMGVATILEARQIELLAFGQGKAAIVQRAVREVPHAQCPATWLQRHPACTFHLDAASAPTL